MKNWLGKIDKKVVQGSGAFTETDIMRGHKRVRDPKEGERDTAHLMAEIVELRRQREEKLLPKPEPVQEKKKEKPPTLLQQRKKKGPVGQWGEYD